MFPVAWLLLLLGVAAVAGPRGGRGAERVAPGPDQPWPIVLDPASGCSCKKQEWSGHLVCFDLMACVRFPRDVRPPTSTLYVRATRIPELAVGDLDGLHHLTELAVENSGQFTRVQPGAFAGMGRLVNLSVSFNAQLRHLEVDALDGLVALRELSLIANGFLELGADVAVALGPGTLPALRLLNLERNRFRAVGPHDLEAMSGSPLEDLSLASCDLQLLHSDALLPLESLTALRLGDNNLNATMLAEAVARMTSAGMPLRSLSLDSVGVHGLHGAHALLLRAVAKSSVTELVLRHNELDKLPAGAFPAMPGLRALDLSHVDLAEGAVGALDASVLPGLRDLDLSGNRLPGLAPGFLSDNLVTLDVSGNTVDPGAGPKPGSTYFNLGAGTFRNMSQLQVLHLSYNRILRLTNLSFVGLSSLKVLTLHNSSLYNLDPGVFLPLRRLEHLDLERNLFASYRTVRGDIFQGLGELKRLLLGGCHITTLGPDPDVFHHLTSLTHLGLQDNALATLDGAQYFRPLRSLTWLDISRNRMASWRSGRLFDANPALRQVRASGNHLTYLSIAMIEDLQGLDVADLADNIFNCGCDFYRPAHAWLAKANQSERDNLTRLFTYKCLSPDRWRDQLIADYMQSMSGSDCPVVGERGEQGDGGAALLVGLPLGLLLVLLVGAAAVAFRFRHHFRYWASAAGPSAGRDATGELSAYVNYQYDAFVSYSNEDQAFVHRLVTMLEQQRPYFRLCVYERDFAVGAAITEAVLGSVALSKRVLLVVSQAFARSHWCAWEAHIAHHQRLLADHALIVVKLGAVDDRLLTPTLRYLLRTRIYLEYDASPGKQRVFWSKLRATLAPPIGKGHRGEDDGQDLGQEAVDAPS